jgi:hypothetical protein
MEQETTVPETPSVTNILELIHYLTTVYYEVGNAPLTAFSFSTIESNITEEPDPVRKMANSFLDQTNRGIIVRFDHRYSTPIPRYKIE